jgi:hypothetical protein
VPPSHEQAWSDALAQEHLHQRELLATLRDELGAFARECASALTALDTFIGLAGVTEILAVAQTGVAHAKLALEVGRRLHGADDPQLVDLYAKVSGGEDAPPLLVRHASELIAAGPKRTDRELLSAVVTASGAHAQIEELIGPAPAAALAALRPIVTWVRTGERQRGDVAKVLVASATLGAGTDVADAGGVAALTDSLRDAVEHVEGAAKAVRDGSLAKVLADARERLEQDLDALKTIHESADEATPDWRAARKAEHRELTEEVRVKLEKVERIRGILLRLLPNLQAVTRALGVVQKLNTLEGRLEPAPAAAVAASHASLVLDVSDLWAAALGGPPSGVRVRRLSRRTKWVGAVAAAVVVAIAGIALASGGSNKPKPVVIETAPATTTAASPAVGPKPSLLPVKAVFDPNQRATFYTVGIEQGGEPVVSYAWTLTTPPGNPTCNTFAPIPGKPNEAVWHHADTDGCTHNGIQHDGTVHVTVRSAHWSCKESFFGTLTRTGSPNAQCTRL